MRAPGDTVRSQCEEDRLTDSRLRQLERRWRETGSATDRAAFLRELARAGALPELARELELRARVERSLLSAEVWEGSSLLGMIVPTDELFENRQEPSARDLLLGRRIAHAAARRAAELAAATGEVVEALALMELLLTAEDPDVEALVGVVGRLVSPTDPSTLILGRRPARAGEAAAQARAAAGWAADSLALIADPQTGPLAAIDRCLWCALACETLAGPQPAGSRSTPPALHARAGEARRRLRRAIAAHLADWLQGADLLPRV